MGPGSPGSYGLKRNHPMQISRSLASLLTLLAALPVLGDVAFARLGGEVEWRYGQFSGYEDGKKVDDLSHFAQRYSVFYTTGARLANGRAGSYQVALGYEWNGLDSEVNGENVDIETGKILYRGRLELRPGGLPVALTLFSEDMQVSRWDDSSRPSSATAPIRTAEVFREDRLGIITNLYNGQRIRSGGTLLLGVANGNFSGDYRDIFTSMPMLFVDYSEDYVKDTESLSPQHYRLRNLALASLNKRDNWLHYRITDYEDYINSDEDLEERQWLLGTVDHTNRRRWINLTNWISVSADTSFTETLKESEGPEPREIYLTNLFARLERNDWRGSTFTNYRRDKDVNHLQLEEEIEIPLYLSGSPSPDTDWRLRLLENKWRRYNDYGSTVGDADRDDKNTVYASGQIDLLKRRPWNLRTLAEVESKRGYQGDGEAARVGLEYFDSPTHRARWQRFVGASAAWFTGTSATQGDVDYQEFTLDGRVETEVTARLRVGARQGFLYGTGAMDRAGFDYLLPRGDTPLSYGAGGTDLLDGDTFRSESLLFAELRGPGRLTNRFEAGFEYRETSESPSEEEFFLRHNLTYSGRAWSASWNNTAVFGEDHRLIAGSAGSDLTEQGAEADVSYRSRGNVSYSPGRAFEIRGFGEYAWASGAEDVSQWRLREEARYSFFTANGALRRIFEVRQELDYSNLSTASGDDQDELVFRLFNRFYPTRILEMGADFKYFLISDQTSTYNVTLLSAVNFQKLKCFLEYSYGVADNSNGILDQEAHRWNLGLTKVF